jgi:hypothetical protein
LKNTLNRVRKLTLGEKAEIALKDAVKKVIEENARLGIPVYVGHEGKLVKLRPENALRPLARNARKRSR